MGAGSEPHPATDRRIVVVGQWRQGQGRVPVPYVEAVAAAGGTPVIASTFDLPDDLVPPGIEFYEHLDASDAEILDGASGLVLPGGGDIDPEWYGREPHPRTHNVSHRRDVFEQALLHVALERDLAVLAICHGMQMLNVFLGGTLEQHLPDNPTRLVHDTGRPDPHAAHRLRLKERGILARALGTATTGVNSHHHQGLDDVAADLEEVGWAEDGVLEAVVSRTHSWIVGVQWHPEVMAPVDEHQANLFRGFVEAAGERAARSPTRAAS